MSSIVLLTDIFFIYHAINGPKKQLRMDRYKKSATHYVPITDNGLIQH